MALTPIEAPPRADRFLAACRREPVDATPVWLMRQAGRVLPAYRELRASHDFLDLIATPDLMTRITLLPFDELDLDAAIMFADIMLPLSALGVSFDIKENVGPVIDDPIRSRADAERLQLRDVREAVPAVFDAVRATCRELDGRVPVIGFAGGPFTLACYLIEGGASRGYERARAMMIGDPAAWDVLMSRLTDLVIAYLHEVVAAGARAVQLFDSWIGVASAPDVSRAVVPYVERIVDAIRPTGVPIISFGTGTGSLLELLAAPDVDVVGVDWRTPLDVAWERIGPDRAVQGNLDPAVLLAPRDVIVERTHDVLRRAGGRPGHIFNLGHGVLPATPLDAIKVLIDTVHGWEGKR